MQGRTRFSQGHGLRLSIVIPTFNGRDVLDPCLRSVMRYRPTDSEVIVVDDGSRDGSAEWLEENYPDVRLVRLPENRGFCVAVNAGIRAARAPIVETLNNDALVTAGWADRVLDLFDDPTVGSVAPLVWMLNANGLVDSAGDQYHISGWAMSRAHFMPIHPELLEVREIFGACASAGFFRRAALERAGAFPEQFGAYYDDVDLAFRLRWCGYRCLYAPYSQLLHRLNHSHSHRDPCLAYQMARNEERVFWYNLSEALLRRAVLPHLIFIAYSAGSKLLRRDNASAYIRGKLAVLRELREIRCQREMIQRIAHQPVAPVRFPIETGVSLLGQRMVRGLGSFFGTRRGSQSGPSSTPVHRPPLHRARRHTPTTAAGRRNSTTPLRADGTPTSLPGRGRR